MYVVYSPSEGKRISILNSKNDLGMHCRHEFLQDHGDWINTVKPAIDPVISSQVCENAELTNEEIENLNAIRNQTRVAINSLLKVSLFFLHNLSNFVYVCLD